MHIAPADPATPEIRALLEEHMAAMMANSPKDACHFLDIEALQKPEVTFWAVRDDAALMGCGALQQIAVDHGEIKSMRTHRAHLRRGVAAAMLAHIIRKARERGYTRLSLETGSGDYFEPAHYLYRAHGFEYCGPFGDYSAEDGFARYMTLEV